MKGALIPAAMALAGLALGGGAAHLTAPGAPEAAHAAAPDDAHGPGDAPAGEDAPAGDAAHEGGHDAAHPVPAVAAKAGGHAAPAAHEGGGHGGSADKGATDGGGTDGFVKLDNQFVVPVIEGGRIASLVVLGLALDVEPGLRETALASEPRLRDAFLRVLFDHANAGGFAGGFTGDGPIGELRAALRESARAVLGPDARDVLILSINRQDA